MPTATSLAGFRLSNLGPLTTTFTPQPTCFPDASFGPTARVQVAYADAPDVPLWMHSCDNEAWSIAGCVPRGSALDDYAASHQHDSGAAFLVAYHSPGLVCPSGWQTASVAERTPGAASGRRVEEVHEGFDALSGTDFGNGEIATVNPGLKVLESALDEGETAVACCPMCVDPLLICAWTAIKLLLRTTASTRSHQNSD